MSNTAGKYILVVDDEEAVLKVVAMHLTADKHRVVTVRNGKDALAAVNKEKPSAVLLDINIGNDYGIDILKQIKAIDPKIPVVMVTGLYDNEEGKKAFAAGAADYVTKPIDFAYLKNTLQIQLL